MKLLDKLTTIKILYIGGFKDIISASATLFMLFFLRSHAHPDSRPYRHFHAHPDITFPIPISASKSLLSCLAFKNPIDTGRRKYYIVTVIALQRRQDYLMPTTTHK